MSFGLIRERSVFYWRARSVLFRIRDLGLLKSDDFYAIVRNFEFWLRDYAKGKYVSLVKDDEYLFIRCVVRFMKVYKRKLWMRFRHLNDVVFDLMLTFTVDPKKFMLYVNELGVLGRGWCRLRA